MARETITLDKQLEDEPPSVKVPPQPNYEAVTEDRAEDSERELQIHNSQIKLQWNLKSKKITAVVIIY